METRQREKGTKLIIMIYFYEFNIIFFCFLPNFVEEILFPRRLALFLIFYAGEGVYGKVKV